VIGVICTFDDKHERLPPNCQLSSFSTTRISLDMRGSSSRGSAHVAFHKWTAQGQDRYLFERIFVFQQSLCCKGTFMSWELVTVSLRIPATYPEKFSWVGISFDLK
jgi:hypothetical protein